MASHTWDVERSFLVYIFTGPVNGRSGWIHYCADDHGTFNRARAVRFIPEDSFLKYRSLPLDMAKVPQTMGVEVSEREMDYWLSLK